MISNFPQPNLEKDETLRTGPHTAISVHVKTWHCAQCGREMGQDYAIHAWDYHKKIICPDCLTVLHTGESE